MFTVCKHFLNTQLSVLAVKRQKESIFFRELSDYNQLLFNNLEQQRKHD